MLDKLKKIVTNKKFIKAVIIIVVLVIVLIITFKLINVVTGGTRSYDKAEIELKNAAVKYYGEHKELLPQQVGDQVAITDQELISAEVLKELSKYVPKDATCTGQVVVKKTVDNYSYTPYLDCGEKYYSTELFKDIISSENVVTTGEGLYKINDEYVYRGEKVNNYIKLGENSLWRIIKVTKDNQLVLISDNVVDTPAIKWDDRFNVDRNANFGINDYKLSRIKDQVVALYNTDFIPDSAKSRMVAMNLCVGKRADNDATNDGSVECSVLDENQMVGLISAYEFLTASLDPNCHLPKDSQCQNYNYLSTSKNAWWTLTGNSANTYNVYRIEYNGSLSYSTASSMARIRPVIMIDNNVMKKSGNGTLDNPYQFK